MGDMVSLGFFGLDDRQIQALIDRYGNSLLPLQQLALREGLLVAEHGLMVSAPTSSGKTLLAELVFLAEAKHDRPVILLVPSKALGWERYTDLSQRYSPLGYRICLSTRDHNHDDRRIVEGTYHLAIIVYEKMRVLMMRYPGLVSSVQLAVIDEIQYISDPDRGADLERLLARLRRYERLRFLGLSAVSASDEFARWLGCKSLVHALRPVELRQGVLCGDRFFYREHNSGREGEERFPLPRREDECQLMLEAARHFGERGESSILFWPTRAACYMAARRLAATPLPWDSQEVPQRLIDLPQSNLKRFLSNLIPLGVAVHTSDLSREERSVVEALARDGKLKVVCSTSTLAEGVNLPAHNVLACRLAYRSGARSARPEIHKLEPQRFLNMIGRAGRLGLTKFGRGMVVTSSQGDVDGLLDRYLGRQTYEIESVLPRQPMQSIVLEALAAGDAATCEEILSWLSDTFGAADRKWRANLRAKIENSLESLHREGYVTRSGSSLVATGLAELATRWGARIATVKRIRQVLDRRTETELDARRILYAIAGTWELEQVYVPITRSEWITRAWSRRLWNNGEEPERAAELRDVRRREKAAKKTLILSAWADGEKMTVLEKSFEVFGGVVRHLADQAAWLLEMTLELAAELGLTAGITRRLDDLRQSVATGLPRAGLAWSSTLAQGFPREYALAMLEAGVASPEQVLRLSARRLEEIVPKTWHRFLPPAPAQQEHSALSGENDHLRLVVDHGRPDRVVLNQAVIPVSQKQFRLLALLASRPMECFSYDTVMEEVWQGVIVEQAQILKLKSLICKRAREAVGPGGAQLLRTIPGRGLVLEAEARLVA